MWRTGKTTIIAGVGCVQTPWQRVSAYHGGNSVACGLVTLTGRYIQLSYYEFRSCLTPWWRHETTAFPIVHLACFLFLSCRSSTTPAACPQRKDLTKYCCCIPVQGLQPSEDHRGLGKLELSADKWNEAASVTVPDLSFTISSRKGQAAMHFGMCGPWKDQFGGAFKIWDMKAAVISRIWRSLSRKKWKDKSEHRGFLCEVQFASPCLSSHSTCSYSFKNPLCNKSRFWPVTSVRVCFSKTRKSFNSRHECSHTSFTRTEHD